MSTSVNAPSASGTGNVNGNDGNNEAELQAQMEQTIANFAVSMAQQQSDRALEAMQEARNENGG